MSKYSIYTVKEKEEIIKFYQANNWKETAKRWKFSRSTLVHWLKRIQVGKKVDMGKLVRKIKKRTIRPETVAFVKALHAKKPNLSLEQIRKETIAKKQKISKTTVWHILTGR